MRVNERMKKVFSILLCLCMVLTLVPTTAFAVDAAEDGLCAHHTAHTPECHYAEAVAGSDCAHVCGEECGETCIHPEHDEDCGYIEAVEAHPCHFVCDQCGAEETTEPSSEATEPSSEATEPEPVPVEESLGTVTVNYAPETDLPGSDELFAYYADGKLYGYEMATFGTRARASLNTVEQAIYDALKAKIEAVASAGGSTVFVLSSVEGLTTQWTNPELNVSYITDNDVAAALAAQFSLDDIVTALLNDCPFDLYWYDKTTDGGVYENFKISYSGAEQDQWTSAAVTELTFTFSVAGSYKSAENTVTSGVSRVSAAKTKAAQIVAAYEGRSDYEKLAGYRDEICALTSYNDAAASDDYTGGYGDPWQLIYVFDGDSTTNVVCEGYAKAFQYLCDLGGLSCISVSGTMAGGTGAGGHMWNVVTLDGENYLVDVTNCDAGTVGEPDELFLVGGTYENGGYSYTIGSQTVTYTCSDLNLSETDYGAAPETSGIPAGYYLVGSLGGEDKWSVDYNASSRLLQADQDTEGQYFLNYTFTAGDQVKIAYFDGTSITRLFQEESKDSYSIGAAKAGHARILFMPAGNSEWSYNFFTVMPLYDVVVSAAENGTVEAAPEAALAGEEVTLTITPAEGYALWTLKVQTGANTPVTVQDNAFTMPGQSVTVEAVFRTTAKRTVYFDNRLAQWENVNIFFWADNVEMIAWPGEAMTVLEGNIYSYEIPADAQTVIFNNGYEQTANQTLDDANCCLGNVSESTWYTYPCTHSFTDGTCTLCGMECTHETYEEGVCTVCSKTCSHLYWVSGKCYVCGTLCLHPSYENGKCASCYTPCPAHQLDEKEFCTVCDMRRIYVDVSYWTDCRLRIGSDYTFLESADGVYSAMLSETATGFYFWSDSGVLFRTYELNIPETGENCYYVEEDSIYESGVQYHDGQWGYHPCVHKWENGVCTVCYAECDHSGNINATTDKGNGKHGFDCSVCEEPVTESHTFTDGACTICEVTGGYCGGEGDGTNLMWTLKDGTLTITGTGAMADYSYYQDPYSPWYSHRATITKLVVGSGVTTLGSSAFYDCTALADVTLPDTLESLGYGAFEDCNALTKISLPDSLTSIGNGAFAECSALKEIVIPEGVKVIPMDTFHSCLALERVTIPASVTSIEMDAFAECPALVAFEVDGNNTVYKSVDGVLFTKDGKTLMIYPAKKADTAYIIPVGVETIGEKAFSSAVNLTAVTIPDSVTEMGSSAFARSSLVTVEFGTGLTEIGPYAFSFCQKLNNLVIPANIEIISSDAFFYCSGLTEITFASADVVISEGAFDNTGLETVNVPCNWAETTYDFGTATLNYIHKWKNGTCTVDGCGVTCDHSTGEVTYIDKGDGTHSFDCTVCGTGTEDHTLTYSASGTTITESCDKGCGHSASATVSAENTTYNGTQQKTATVTYSEGWTGGELTVSYENNINAGTATASITLGEATASVDFTIAKATVTVTADAKSKTYGAENPELTYTTSGLFGSDTLTGALATTATRTSDVGEYDITVGTLANSNYTINFVGAKLSIAKAAAPTIVWPTAAELTYGQKLSESTLTSNDSNGTFAWQDSNTVPTVTNSGYVVVYTPKDTNNYDYTGVALEQTIPVTVSKAEPSIIWKSGYYNTYGTNMYITASVNGVDGEMIPGTAVATVYDVNGNALSSVTCTKTDSTGTYFFNWLNQLSDGTYLTPGQYNVKLTYQGSDNYGEKTVELVTYTINKRALTVTANDNTITYGDEPAANGVTYSGFASGETEAVLGGELTYTYGYEQYGDVGTYTITPAGLTSDNYEIAFVDGTLTVDAKTITVTADALSKTYGDADPKLTYKVEGLVNGDQLTGELKRVAGENVGSYAIEQNTLTAGSNYRLTYTGENLTINKRNGTITAKDQTITYGVTISNAEITSVGLINGHSVVVTLTPSTANVTVAGTITASAAIITADDTDVTANYEITYAGGKLVIEPDTSKIDGLTEANVTSANEADIKAVQEMMANADSVKDEWAAISTTCENLTQKIEAVEEENARISNAVSRFDLTSVKSTDETAITQLISDIDAQLATENLTDEEKAELENLKTKCNNLIAKIDGTETLIGQLDKAVDDLDAGTIKSADKAALEQVVADAQTLIDSGNVTEAEKEALKQIQEDAKALIKVIDDTAAAKKEATDEAATFDAETVKSTDKANLTQLAEDIEALLDTENLTEDERTALEAVLEQVNGMIDTIEETAGDSKEATDAIDALDPATVTSADKDELEQAIETIDELLEGDNLTEEERKTLEDAKADAKALIDVIDAAADATDTENTEKVEDVTPENVGLEDKEALEDAKADLEKALEDNSGNYTEEEKKAIQEEIDRIDDAIAALENVEDVTETVTQLPESVEPDDEAAAEKILAASEAYDALTDHEKSLVDEDAKKKLDDLVAALTAYDIIKGDGSSWTQDSNGTISFTANGAYNKFVGIKVDGVEAPKANYEAKSGSTIITLKASYLDTLAVGEHTITVVYTDGSTDGTFKIVAKPNNPATGDDFNIALYCSLMVVSVTALVVLLLASKKRKQAK